MCVSVYDNASGDETEAVVRELARGDDRVKYHCHPENVGAFRNFNYGMMDVKTPYFAVLSDDDIVAPTFFEKALQAFGAFPEAQLACMPTLTVDAELNVIEAPIEVEHMTFYKAGEALEGDSERLNPRQPVERDPVPHRSAGCHRTPRCQCRCVCGRRLSLACRGTFSSGCLAGDGGTLYGAPVQHGHGSEHDADGRYMARLVGTDDRNGRNGCTGTTAGTLKGTSHRLLRTFVSSLINRCFILLEPVVRIWRDGRPPVWAHAGIPLYPHYSLPWSGVTIMFRYCGGGSCARLKCATPKRGQGGAGCTSGMATM